MPPTLAPLNAMLIAFGRSRSNQGATMALSAAPLVAAQPAPLSIKAGTSCHGCCTFAQRDRALLRPASRRQS